MWIMVAPVPLPAPTDEFVGRVARVLGVREDEAEVHILAVFATLREAVTWGELEEMVAQLEPEDAVLLA